MAARTAYSAADRTAYALEAMATSPAAVAARLGLDASVVRKWAYRYRLTSQAPAPTFVPVEVETAPEVVEPFRLGGSAADRKVVSLEAEVARLRKALRDAHKSALADDEMREILGSMAATPAAPPHWLAKPAVIRSGSAEVPIAPWADWHLGETVTLAETAGRNEYSVDIAERRVERLVENTIDLIRHHGPKKTPGIVIPLMGDFVSGGLHPELAKSDELSVIPSSLKCRDILVAAIDRMAAEFGSVYLPSVCGNHGRATPKPEFKGYTAKNFDWLIYEMLRRHYANDPRVVVDSRPANEVLFQVFGTRILVMHGDMMGVKGGDGIIGSLGPIARGEVKVRGHAAEAYDVLLIGHWHQELWLPRCIVSNTLKGYDEYARLSLRAPCTKPSQPLFFVHPERGITSRWSVAIDDKPAVTRAPWLQVFQGDAA